MSQFHYPITKFSQIYHRVYRLKPDHITHGEEKLANGQHRAWLKVKDTETEDSGFYTCTKSGGDPKLDPNLEPLRIEDVPFDIPAETTMNRMYLFIHGKLMFQEKMILCDF